MDWFQLVSAVGLGAIVVKVLDIYWLQHHIEQHQKADWLREKRLQAFSDVTKELISFGLHDKGLRNAFESYGAISQAMLLIDDDGLIKRIDHFIVDLDRLNRMNDSKDETKKDAEKLYESLVSDAREITRLLRNVILHDRIRGL